MKLTSTYFWNLFKSSSAPTLSEYPTYDERETYILYKINQVFKNNFSNHAQVKTEVTDHFIEAIESSSTPLTKQEFLSKYEELYNSFGKGTGIRKMVYDRVLTKQSEEYEAIKNIFIWDICFVSGITGGNSAILIDSSAGTGKYLVYISLIALSLLLVIAATKVTSLYFSEQIGDSKHRYMQLIIKNIKWTIISLLIIAFYFSLDETLLGAKFLTQIIFVAAYYNCRRYCINHVQDKRRSQLLTPLS